MQPLIRPAVADDQSAIVTLVRSERLNPTNLDWRRFFVAISEGTLIGAVQIRHHGDGARELGSLVVKPAFRRQGIAKTLISAALRDVSETVWIVTGRDKVGHYAAWGFVPAMPWMAPRSVRFNYRVGRAMRLVLLLKGIRPKILTLLVRN
jgi:amino-acid N-acetyltransferase